MCEILFYKAKVVVNCVESMLRYYLKGYPDVIN